MRWTCGGPLEQADADAAVKVVVLRGEGEPSAPVVTGAMTGVLLNNRMTCWHLDDAHANALKPGKRVPHTMKGPMVLRDGKVWAMFGPPGADD